MGRDPTPARQHLAAYEVLPAMKREAEYFLTRSTRQTLVLAIKGGALLVALPFWYALTNRER